MASEFKPLGIKAGVVKNLEPWDAQGYWTNSDKIRFVDGRPRKIGGVTQYTPETYLGTPRDLWTWNDLMANQLAAFGTEALLYLVAGGGIYDITPVRTSVSANNIFSVSAGSPDVVVSVAAHGAVDGDGVEVTGFTTIGANVYLSGTYIIASVVGADSFILSAPMTAAATSASTGTGNISFFIAAASSNNGSGLGFGTGTYGTSTYSTPRGSSNSFVAGRQWSLDNFGERLVANPRGDTIYVWDPQTTVTQHANAVTAAPTVVNSILVSEADRHMFALGCSDETGVFDPMLVRWCASENYNDWLASATNTAGSKRLSTGNYIVGGLRAKNQNLVWTDNSLEAFIFSGPPYTFTHRNLGTNSGMISQHGAAELNGKVYWIGDRNFYCYDGVVRILPCPVLDWVFDNMSTTQGTKVFAGIIKRYGEVIWLFPDKDSMENTLYVKYNSVLDVWDIGTFEFSVWRDQGVFQNALAAATQGPLMYVDVSTTPDFNGSPMPSYIQGYPLDADAGESVLFIDAMIPNFTVSGTTQVTFQAQRYPQDTTVTKGPYTVSASTPRFGMRIRGRLVSVLISTSAVGDSWKFGTPRLRMRADGKQ